MAPKTKAVAAAAPPPHGYEFFGPIGAAGISFGLPILCYIFTFACNDISGCPAPSLLSPTTLSIEQLKREVGWPQDGIYGLASWRASAAMAAYYLFNLILYRILPATETKGTVLVTGGRLIYRLNTLYSNTLTLSLLAAGTLAQGAEFPVWVFISENYLQLLTASIIISYAIATFVYVRSFSVKAANTVNRELAAGGLQLLTASIIISYAIATFVYVRSFSVKAANTVNRELAAGGHTGNLLYDWFIGRELNPRVTIPLIGEVDIKEWCELRPGMMGWIILNCAWCAQQYRNYGFVTDSIVCITVVQALYIFDSWWFESAILTTMDITTDGFGMMLAFGDLVWVPFVYSQQTRYLSLHPLSLGPVGLAAMLSLIGLGFFVFRSANSQKNTFRTNPSDPSVAHLKYIQTKTGSKLLTTGWWGVSRHINYLGDWIQSWPYCLPTGLAGYQIMAAGSLVEDSVGAFVMSDGRQVIQGNAKGWAIPITYFYVVYFAVLLIHRERRDDEKCHRKYGDDWVKYKEAVRWRIIPGIY